LEETGVSGENRRQVTAGQTLSPKVVSGTPPYERDLNT
jgi:hypothetical protein